MSARNNISTETLEVLAHSMHKRCIESVHATSNKIDHEKSLCVPLRAPEIALPQRVSIFLPVVLHVLYHNSEYIEDFEKQTAGMLLTSCFPAVRHSF